jgi:hypothetical protein
VANESVANERVANESVVNESVVNERVNVQVNAGRAAGAGQEEEGWKGRGTHASL